MNQAEIKQRFSRINTWKKGHQRAPHKPLLLLFALGWYSQRKTRLIPFEQIDGELQQLLGDFGPPRKSFHSEYPFWRLQKDQLWEVTNKEFLQVSASGDVKKRELLEHQVSGGLPEEMHLFLKQHPETIPSLAAYILSEHFPETRFEEIIEAVGLAQTEATYDWTKKKRRDPQFRYAVLDAYEHRCAMCGFDVRLGEKSVGLEAAHIQWDSHNGPSQTSNGLSLCSLHHKLFDAGAWGLSDHHNILISPRVNGSRGVEEWLLKYEGKQLLLPSDQVHEPSGTYSNWHRKEVFKRE